MSAAVLMSKLLEIERSVGRVDPMQVRNMVLDAENSLLEYQQEILHTLHSAAEPSGIAPSPRSAAMPRFRALAWLARGSERLRVSRPLAEAPADPGTLSL